MRQHGTAKVAECRPCRRQVLFADRLLGFGKEIIAAAMIVGHEGPDGGHGELGRLGSAHSRGTAPPSP
jgi:hypothetical protein